MDPLAEFNRTGKQPSVRPIQLTTALFLNATSLLTTLVMFAETVSLGILSLPSVLAEIGMVPGVIMILVWSYSLTATAVSDVLRSWA